MHMRTATFSAVIFFCSFFSSFAEARPVQCLLQVDGRVYIDGDCYFKPLSSGSGGFQIAGAGGKYFAYLYVEGPDMGSGHWNGAIDEARAHTPLGALRRDGACWTNATVKLCAW